MRVLLTKLKATNLKAVIWRLISSIIYSRDSFPYSIQARVAESSLIGTKLALASKIVNISQIVLKESHYKMYSEVSSDLKLCLSLIAGEEVIIK